MHPVGGMNHRQHQARVWWAAVLAADYLRHGRRRKIPEIAEDSGTPQSSMRRQIAECALPDAVRTHAIAEAVGIDRDVLWAIFTDRPVAIDTKTMQLRADREQRGETA